MKTQMKNLLTAHATFAVAVAALIFLATPAQAGIVGVDSITVTSSTYLDSITVGTYTVDVSDLCNGDSSGSTYTSTGTPTWPIANADDFNVLGSCASLYNPVITVSFGGSNWWDTNGDNPDFFIFDNGNTEGGGGNDSGTIQAIFTDNSLGNTISYTASTWGDTGYNTSGFPSAPRDCVGIAFKITDLLDNTGTPLTNSTIIKGIRINDTGIDPTCICAVTVPEPSTMILGGLGILGFLLRLRRRPRA